jgi:type III restriction enzyme
MDALITNPVLNSPFEEPTRHFRFTDDGITNEEVPARRLSGYFVPIPQPRKKGKQQLDFGAGWTQDRFQESEFINRVRARAGAWRAAGYPNVTRVTRNLLDHWNDPSRERRLFFCQREAVETAIYLAEAAPRTGDAWIENDLRRVNEAINPGLLRVAFKMATGSGKTLVMGMLIAWQALNKLTAPQDARFSDAFLLVAPGITIRDRLRVLLPNDPESYYRQHDLVPADLAPLLGQAQVAIVNFHAFLRRERGEASKLTKQIVTRGREGAFKESPAEMVRRVCRDLGNKRNLVVINDEAHHCYRPRTKDQPPPAGAAAAPTDEKLTADERREAKKREREARVWLDGLLAIRQRRGVRAVFDLSATPFFLRGSGYREGDLFPWVVSDFSLIDAIESGIVKVPRVPVADDAMTGEVPAYRDLWQRIREDLPVKGRGTAATSGPPQLPGELEGALQVLYDNYVKTFERWQGDARGRAGGTTPPVFIVVCNNTNVSKLVFDYVSGFAVLGADGEPRPGPDGRPLLVPGKLPLFSNVAEGAWSPRPNTILVDSEELESGEGLSADFKKLAATEIAEWKEQYRLRFPGRDAEDLTDEDLLREVLNTVGKPGKLGEGIRCVVSVSMLTEGWDANTVTHILGVRAFGTQLLCEQVVGRGLRRTSYAVNSEGRFDPEYAEVYGVPFSFIPASGATPDPPPRPPTTRVRALPEREHLALTFPRVLGYRYEVAAEPLEASWGPDHRMELSTADVPTWVENAPIVGETVLHSLEGLRQRRPQEVAFEIARLVLERYFRATGDGAAEAGAAAPTGVHAWRFPAILRLTQRWLRDHVVLKDDTFPQLLLLGENLGTAANKVYGGIVRGTAGEARLRPILPPYEVTGSSRHVGFDTVRPTWQTSPDKCNVSHVVADTDSWEQKTAQALEGMPEVLAYVKNDHVGLAIPWADGDRQRSYFPDFLVRVDDGRGGGDPLHLVLEVSGHKDPAKVQRVATARELWVPAVNADGSFGRWAFLELPDPWSAKTELRAFLASRPERAA